jgi:hypothetical protein
MGVSARTANIQPVMRRARIGTAIRCMLAPLTCLVALVLTTTAPVGAAADSEGSAENQPETQKVTLIAAGHAPRAPLRVTMTAGQTVQGAMEMTESVKQSLEGIPFNDVTTPPIRIIVHVNVASVAPNGDAQVSLSYSDVGVVDDGSLDDATLAQYQTALGPLSGISATGTLTSRNRLRHTQYAGLDQLDRATSQTVSQLADEVGVLTVPYPKRPVGVGARWRAVSTIHSNGLSVRQAFTYTLRERHGNEIALDVAISQTAPPQQARFPGMPTGAEAELVRWRGTGSGRISMDLTEPLLSIATSSTVRERIIFKVRAEGEPTQPIVMTAKAEVDFKR